MLLMLTWAAGSVNAISYLGLGHVFTAMMRHGRARSRDNQRRHGGRATASLRRAA
jgi:hypothetical protein